MKTDLMVDPERAAGWPQTGIYVRARRAEKWGSHDIGELDRASLVQWLGYNRELAINVVCILLGHEPTSL